LIIFQNEILEVSCSCFNTIYLFFSIYIAIVLEKPLKIHKEIEVYIPKGASFYTIASTFKDKGLIKDEYVFIIAGKLLGIEKRQGLVII